MAGIVFYFEDKDTDVWSGREITAWYHAIKCAGDIDTMIIVNNTDQHITSPDQSLRFSTVKELPELEGTVTYLEVNDESVSQVDLWDFDHNTDWYVFGPAMGWHPRKNNSLTVSQNFTGHCHSIHIAYVVMMHRCKTINRQ